MDEAKGGFCGQYGQGGNHGAGPVNRGFAVLDGNGIAEVGPGQIRYARNFFISERSRCRLECVGEFQRDCSWVIHF